MNLESIKKIKFDDFSEFSLKDAVKVIGGTPVGTCMNGQDDSYDYATNKTNSKDGAGNSWDFYYPKKTTALSSSQTI